MNLWIVLAAARKFARVRPLTPLALRPPASPCPEEQRGTQASTPKRGGVRQTADGLDVGGDRRLVVFASSKGTNSVSTYWPSRGVAGQLEEPRGVARDPAVPDLDRVTPWTCASLRMYAMRDVVAVDVREGRVVRLDGLHPRQVLVLRVAAVRVELAVLLDPRLRRLRRSRRARRIWVDFRSAAVPKTPCRFLSTFLRYHLPLTDLHVVRGLLGSVLHDLRDDASGTTPAHACVGSVDELRHVRQSGRLAGLVLAAHHVVDVVEEQRRRPDRSRSRSGTPG